MTVGIVCDGGVSLPRELRDAVRVVPLQREDGSTPAASPAARGAAGHPGTAAPSPGAFLEAIEQADRGNGVLVLTVASAFSAAFGAARLAATSARAGGHRVEVLDSRTATVGQGLVAQAAFRSATGGDPLAVVAARASEVSRQVRLVALIAQLDELARSGRVPGVVAATGRVGVRPLFEVRDGAVRRMRPAFGLPAAERRVAREIVREAHDLQPHGLRRHHLHLAALHGHERGSADRLLDIVRRHVVPATSFVAELSPPMMLHTGPGVSGLAWWWEDAP